MNKIHMSPSAQNDLLEIKAYIEDELLNPPAAVATISRIIQSLRILETYAYAGASLDSVTDIKSDYRYLVSGNYISFYRVYGADIYIDRVLYAARDYMQVLFNG